MALQKGLECVSCGSRVPFSPQKYSSCCFSPYAPFYAPAHLTRDSIQSGPRSLFRYIDLLPADSIPDSDIGFTTLVRAQWLGQAIGSSRLYVKDEDEPKTGTFKDRGVGVASQKVEEFNGNGCNYVALGGSSTGNLSLKVLSKNSFVGIEVPDSHKFEVLHCFKYFSSISVVKEIGI